MTLLAAHTEELLEISTLPAEQAPRRAASLLADLVKDPAFVEAEIVPSLEGGGDREGWYVARQYDGEDGSYSLKVFVWPAGTGTKVHDHSSWGAYAWGGLREAEWKTVEL